MIALDSSALIAYAYREPGGEKVAAILPSACMSTVNLAESLERLTRDGMPMATVAAGTRALPIEWVPFDWDLARATAELRASTAFLGLSLGDRACLALAIARGIPAMTADRMWNGLQLGVTIELIR